MGVGKGHKHPASARYGFGQLLSYLKRLSCLVLNPKLYKVPRDAQRDNEGGEGGLSYGFEDILLSLTRNDQTRLSYPQALRRPREVAKASGIPKSLIEASGQYTPPRTTFRNQAPSIPLMTAKRRKDMIRCTGRNAPSRRNNRERIWPTMRMFSPLHSRLDGWDNAKPSLLQHALSPRMKLPS